VIAELMSELGEGVPPDEAAGDSHGRPRISSRRSHAEHVDNAGAGDQDQAVSRP
jgi:hypothetical protein